MILDNFIVFEGIDGAGTTTQIGKLLEVFEKKGMKAVKTMEPTDSDIGRLIASFLSQKLEFSECTVARLFACDRCEHIYGKNGILHLLKESNIVLSDRYLFSSLAYQGRGKLQKLTKNQNKDFPLPKVLFLLDIPAERAIARINMRGDATERYEKVDFLRFVRENYLKIIDEYKEKEPLMSIKVVDASFDEENVFYKIKTHIEELGFFSKNSN